MRIKETGMFARYLSKFYTKKPICVSRQNFQSISIDDSLPALLLIPYGIAFAFTVMLVEKLMHFMKFSRQFCGRF
jgi:hypothetical protein